MATGSRLTAVAALAVTAWVAAHVPTTEGWGIVALAGGSALVLLGGGLVAGSRRMIHAAVALLVLRVVLAGIIGSDPNPPVWAQAGAIGAVAELAALSFTWRVLPTDPVVEWSRVVAVTVGLMAASAILEMATAGLSASGVLGHTAGVAALVAAVGAVSYGMKRRLESSRQSIDDAA